MIFVFLSVGSSRICAVLLEILHETEAMFHQQKNFMSALWIFQHDTSKQTVLFILTQQLIKGKILLSIYGQLCVFTVWRNWQVISCLD